MPEFADWTSIESCLTVLERVVGELEAEAPMVENDDVTDTTERIDTLVRRLELIRDVVDERYQDPDEIAP